MNITGDRITDALIGALIVAIVGLVTSIIGGIVRFKDWRAERRSKRAHEEFRAASEEAQAVADDLKRRVLEAEALEVTGQIAVVKTSRKGRSGLDKTVVAAGEITRLADAELDRVEGKP